MPRHARDSPRSARRRRVTDNPGIRVKENRPRLRARGSPPGTLPRHRDRASRSRATSRAALRRAGTPARRSRCFHHGYRGPRARTPPARKESLADSTNVRLETRLPCLPILQKHPQISRTARSCEAPSMSTLTATSTPRPRRRQATCPASHPGCQLVQWTSAVPLLHVPSPSRCSGRPRRARRERCRSLVGGSQDARRGRRPQADRYGRRRTCLRRPRRSFRFWF